MWWTNEWTCDLIEGVARLRPEWHLIMIGPVVKIDPATLPRHPNIHYLGQKAYSELPAYIAGWDVAMLPFALNDSTRFISPTKTPEYLAAGKPVVSTPIRDVVRPYGEMNLVYIARTPEEFVECIEAALAGGETHCGRNVATSFLPILRGTRLGRGWPNYCIQRSKPEGCRD